MQPKTILSPTSRAVTALKKRAFITSPTVTAWLCAALLAVSVPTAAIARSLDPTPKSPTAPAASATPTAAAQQCPPQPATDPAVYRAEAQKPHPDQGVLWQLRKGEQTGYLLGSIHVGKLPWILPGPRTAQALRDAPAIALELDPTDPATLQALARAMGDDSNAQKAIMQANPALQTRMAAQAQALCIDDKSWQVMGTVAKIVALSMSDMANSGYHMAYGIDIHLASIARAMGKPVKALETADEQITAMGMGANASATMAATAPQITKILDDIASGKSRKTTQALTSYWQAGDIAGINKLMRECDCMDDLGSKTALLDDRNQRMAERIPALLAQHPKLFITVGMLHMVGDNNLLQLLEKQGFEIRQLTGKGATP